MVEFAEQAAAVDTGRLRDRVDVDVPQRRQVELHAAVAGRLAGEAVAAAFHGKQQAVVPGEADGTADVRRAGRLHDERRVLVEGGIQQLAGVVVARTAREQQFALQAVAEFLHGRFRERYLRPVTGYRIDVRHDLGRAVERVLEGSAGR